MATVAAIALPATPSDAQEPEADEVVLPDSFNSAASASALDVLLLGPPLVPVPDLIQFRVAEGRGSYSGSNQEARASVFFPGNGALLGPGLACGQAGSQFPPESEPLFGPVFAACLAHQYPLAVFADSLAPDGQTEGAAALGGPGDPVSMQAAGARAHAGIDATFTDAEIDDFRIAGAPALGSLEGLLAAAGLEPADATVVGADGVTAVTDQRVVDGALVATAEATVTGVRMLGGLVRIGSIVSRSTLTSASGADAVLDTSLEVGGVEVAGTPAQLTEDGLVVGGAGPAAGPLAQQAVSQVAALLQDRGFRMTLLPVEEGEIDGVPFTSAGGVLIEFSTPIVGLPPVPGPLGDLDVNGTYGVQTVLGTTGVRGIAQDFDNGPVTQAGPVAPSSPVIGGGGIAPLPAPRSLPVVPPQSSPDPGGADTGAPGPLPAAPGQPVGFLEDLFADRLGFLYLSFTLTALGLCLAPRLALPARLPRGTG